MCANYTYHPDENELQKSFKKLKIDKAAPFDEVKGSIFPFTYAPVIVANKSDLMLTAKRYSLTPAWADTPKVKFATYNARMNRPSTKKGKEIEHIYEVPTWREPFAKFHCLVPMNEFKESCHEGVASGHIVRFVPKEGGLLFAAGIYSDWVDKKTGEVLSTFAIVTTDPDGYIKKVGHDRSPVFLNPQNGADWLSDFKTGKDAYDFLMEEHLRPKLEYVIERKLKSAK
jgi:putative SOS response-associated peptidase YedK